MPVAAALQRELIFDVALQATACTETATDVWKVEARKRIRSMS